MRRAGRVVAEVLALVESELKPGVSTAHLDALAEAHIRRSGALPSFKGYPGANPRRPFPASICVSIDDEIVHGIPGERTIREGQVVSIDAGAIVDGWHGDGARTFFVGQPARAGPRADRDDPPGDDGRDRGGPAGQPDRGHRGGRRGRRQAPRLRRRSASSSATASAGRCTRTRRSPTTARSRPSRRIEPGLCLAIEPMFTLGSYEAMMLPDDWTIVTRDGSLAAHFEHTIAITEHGPEILTTV